MNLKYSRNAALRLLAAAGALMAAFAAQAQLPISNVPAFLPSPLPPNIVLTLDDSGSMERAYVPDNLGGSSPPSTTVRASRAFKSAAFNALYYNPDIVYPLPVDANGNPLSTSFTAAPINGFANGTTGPSSRGTVNLSSQYRPTFTYSPGDANGGNANNGQVFANHTSADLTALGVASATTGGPAYYYRYTGAAACVITDDACYQLVIVSATSGTNPLVGADERQNFANWYSFYRTRNLLTVSAASRAFAGIPTNTRVAWQSLNSCSTIGANCDNWTGSGATNSGVRPLSDATSNNPTASHRGNMYNWLFRLPANNSTPLRTAMSRAGRYFRRDNSQTNNPYAEFPQASTTAARGREWACRPNFHILMTDGIWNQDSDTGSYCVDASGTNVACGNADRPSSSFSLPDGVSYDIASASTRLYRDGNSNSVADIAFHYWATDLRADLDNILIPYLPDKTGTVSEQYFNPKNDPARWQHMVTFTVGLGLTNTLSVSSPIDLRWGGDTFANPGFGNFKTGTGDAPWPATAINASPGNVYDLWHAALNSRGRAFSADNPTQLSDALQSALNRILERQSSASGLAANTTRLVQGTRVYQARFDSSDWSGWLLGFDVNPNGTLGSQVWSTKDSGKIPDPASRAIVTWGGTSGIDFSKTALTAAGLWPSLAATPAAATATTVAVEEDDFFNYVRGDSSKEQKNANGIYRNRSTPVGDIVNSTPAYVGRDNFGYTGLPEGLFASSTPYQSFVESQSSRDPMIYVGSNGGMLHAFDALSGAERFAFVPQAVVPNLKQLANPEYAHRFFVDGSPRVRDAFVNGQWRTVLIGTGGAGAKTVFALDVTDPDALGTSSVLWELNESTPNSHKLSGVADPDYANDLGVIVGQGIPVKLNNGSWVAIFGNGLNSVNNRAVLYIVRLSDGALIRKIETGIGTAATPNGLGTPTLYDANSDSVFDAAYATDMRGNVWKFDLSSTDPANWRIAFTASTGFPNGTPLFQARSATGAVQPIQARVELAKPAPGVPGIMVLFGTGRLLAVGDNVDTTGQSFYGILDNGSAITTTNRSQLVQQTISTSTVDFGGVPTIVRTVSSNTVDWTTRRGWFIDLPISMERSIGTAAVRNGRVIFATQIPSEDPCLFGGTSWLMQVDARTGQRFDQAVFDSTGDGLVNSSDSLMSGLQTNVGLVVQPTLIDGVPTGLIGMSGTSGNVELVRTRADIDLGRNSWRQAR
jgi:type IV pilus assembly protein PilY1